MDLQTLFSRITPTVSAILHISFYDVHVLRRRWTRWLRHLLAGRNLPMFSELALETTAHCNRHCPACPVAVAPRGKDVMDDALFAKILGELSAMNFSGRIALHFFNEPLLDRQIVTKVRRVAAAAPRSSIEINSNGDFLTPALAKELFDAGLAFLFVTAYNDRAMKRLIKMKTQMDRREHRRTVMRRAPEFMGNRAGSLAAFAIPESLQADCFQPSYKLVINYKGEAVICTSDYFANPVMGHIKHQTLQEIWQSPTFRQARNLLSQRARHKLTSCKGCNLINTPLHYGELSAAQVIAYNKGVHDKMQGVVNPKPVT